MIMAPNMASKLLAADSYVFLLKELEKTDPKIYEPLSGTDWPRDMPVVTGGGIMENIVTIDVTYASSGVGEGNLFFDKTNDIPVIQADMSKAVARCFNFGEYMVFNWLENEKMTAVGRDPETFLNKGIRLHCDKVIDQNVYKGFTSVSSTGLLNCARITRISAANNAGGTSTHWADKTADEILADVNTILAQTWQANDCASDALPNHILVPVDQFGLLVTRKVADDSERSILTYILENNLTAVQGGELTIAPIKWAKGIGSNNTDRMIAYMNRDDRVCFNITQPLTRLETELTNMSYKIPYVCQFSEVRFLYPTTCRYMDGI